MALLLEPDRYLGETRDHRPIVGLTLTETLHRQPVRLPRHTHATPYFCLVMRGSYDEQVSGSMYEVRSGELLFHPSGETHANRIRSAGTLIFNISLSRSWAGLLSQLELRGRPRPGRQSAASARVVRRVAREVAARDAVSSLAIEGLVLTLLGEAARSPAELRGGPPRWLPVALDFIRAHFRTRLDHEALARVTGVHATHLARAFHHHVGRTVTDHVHQLRIEWARVRIEGSDTPLADVALDAGFADQAHFSRVFRRHTGTTPSEHRRRARSRRP